MIPAVAQTLANILAGGVSTIGLEQIDFNPPKLEQDAGVKLNLYCYDLRENRQFRPTGTCPDGLAHQACSTIWFDLSFLVTARDGTALGEQRLLSEALILLLRYRFLPEKLLARTLRGYGLLPVKVSTSGWMNTAALWSALGVPLRPALYVTVTVPFSFQVEASQPQEFQVIPTQ
jgi:hypothetical protein